MKSAILLCLLGTALCYTIEKKQEFIGDEACQTWKSSHNKAYSDLQEEKVRYTIWQDNLVRRIVDFNKKSTNLFLRMNHFGDMTNTEYRANKMNGYLSPRKNSTGSTFLPPSNVKIRCRLEDQRLRDTSQKQWLL